MSARRRTPAAAPVKPSTPAPRPGPSIRLSPVDRAALEDLRAACGARDLTHVVRLVCAVTRGTRHLSRSTLVALLTSARAGPLA